VAEVDLPYKVKLPDTIMHLDPFIRVIVVKVIREEKLLNGLKAYIEIILGR
jgi:hypothetical protein